MPKRTNTFQQVVTVIHKHLPGDAKVEESAMVTPRSGGQPREVDVLITSVVKGVEIRIAVEACRHHRKANVEWVDMMIGKHAPLPTDRLVLFSASGFSQPAIDKARENRIVTVTEEPIPDEDLASSVLHGLPTLWQKFVVLRPDSARVWVLRSDGSTAWFKGPHDLALFLEDGVEFPFDLRQTIIMRLKAEMPRFVEQAHVGQITESIERPFTVIWCPFLLTVNGKEQGLLVRTNDDPPNLQPIQQIEAKGTAVVEVQRIDLTHARFDLTDAAFGEVRVAYGEVSAGGQKGVLIVSDASGEQLVTLRLGTEIESTSPVIKPQSEDAPD